MLSIILRIAAVTVIGGLAAFAGYRIIHNDNPDADVSEISTIATVDGVPADMGTVEFGEGQRADRVAVPETTENFDLGAEGGPDMPAPGTEQVAQIRGLPTSGDDEEETPEETQEDDAATEAADAENDTAEAVVTKNPVIADKKDDEDGFTTNPRLTDKKDGGQYYTANPKRVAKVDDGAYYTENTKATEFDPCLKADGTPYQGPGTALNPFAPVSPCLPKATAESYAALLPEDIPEPDDEEYGPPKQPEYFAPDPPVPPTQGGSDYRTI